MAHERSLAQAIERARASGVAWADSAALSVLSFLAVELERTHERGQGFGGFSEQELQILTDGTLQIQKPTRASDASLDLQSFQSIKRSIRDLLSNSGRPPLSKLSEAHASARAERLAIQRLANELGVRINTDDVRNLVASEARFEPTLRLDRPGKQPPEPARVSASMDAWTGGSIRIPLPQPEEPPKTREEGPKPTPREESQLTVRTSIPAALRSDPPPPLGVVPKSADPRSNTPTERTTVARKKNRALLWAAGGAAGALVAALLFQRPEPPIEVLVRMRPVQEEWLKHESLARFTEANGRSVHVSSYRDISDVESALVEHPASLVKVEASMLRPLAEKDLILPLDRISRNAELTKSLESTKAAMSPLSLELAKVPDLVGRPLMGLPRKLETHLLVFRKSKVEDARSALDAFLPELNQDLERLTGAQLPTDYTLETDPNEWDLFDVLALAYIWKKTPESGVKKARILLRTYSYIGTYIRLMNALAGSTAEAAVTPGASTALIDVLEWESLFQELGLFDPEMSQKDALVTGRRVSEAFLGGEVFLIETHTLDIGLIAQDPTFPRRDLGVAMLPKRVSLALDNSGIPMRVGTRRAFVTGWVWAVPKTSRSPEESLKLALALESRDEVAKEAQVFWIQTSRTDVDFGGREIAEVVQKQMTENESLVLPSFKSVASFETEKDRLVGAWWDVVAGRKYLEDGKISRARIKKVLEERFGR